MKHWFPPLLSTLIVTLTSSFSFPAFGETKQGLTLVYPPLTHQTTADRIFLIGTAPVTETVYVNGNPIEQSAAGHFAPSFPLQRGDNQFTLRYNNQEIRVEVTRVSAVPEPPPEGGFASNSLTPSQPIARLPEELICLEAVGSPQAEVFVTLNNQVIPLAKQSRHPLPPNYAVLTGNNQPLSQFTQLYQGCFTPEESGYLGNPVYTMNLGDQTFTVSDTADITILSPEQLPVIEVTSEAGVARTGPGTSYSRLTPLPQGTMATVNGREGEWLRLAYGAWIKAEETELKPDAVPPHTLIRSIQGKQTETATEIVFPLQLPVPVSVKQGENTFTLTLHHTTAQTDTIRLDDDPLIKRLDWEQVDPETVEYTFHLKSEQQWGYQLRYEGSRLILSLKYPPPTSQNTAPPLTGMRILLDPGHGGEELGARGPTGYPEKAVNLIVSKLLREELEKLGATVYMTRETDRTVSLGERVAMINQLQPTIALSIHYNALPDDGDAMNTSGIGVFWYNPPAHDLAVFLHNYLVEELNRPSYGIFWNTLALTRPHTTLAVLLELGFMIHPTEFEWITNPQAQQELVDTLAEGIKFWQENQNQR
jgi:N-acetylmuramoyl-L-alanine amidase